MRRLILIRHAKAEGAAASDRARALTARGRDDAAALGMRLGAAGMVPDGALVSVAARAEQTWLHLGVAASSAAVSRSEALYHAQASEVLAMIGDTDDGVAALAVVGHNPTIHELALALVNPDGPDALVEGFPAGAAAVIDFGVARWAEVGVGSGRLVAFVTSDQFRSTAL